MATGHLKEGVCKSMSENTLRDLQDIVVEGSRCMCVCVPASVSWVSEGVKDR